MASYLGATITIRTRTEKAKAFRATEGVLQGDTLAPFLFVVSLDKVLRLTYEALPEDVGLIMKERLSSRDPALHLSHTAFADDLALLFPTLANARLGIAQLVIEASKANLVINEEKTFFYLFIYFFADDSAREPNTSKPCAVNSTVAPSEILDTKVASSSGRLL